MALFNIKNSALALVKEKRISLERELQELTEKNLGVIFGLKFVASEFSLNQLRIDTLAYDSESKSFVLIEYKRDRSFSVIDQGFAYLALLLNNQADFVLKLNEKLGLNLRKEDIEWSSSKVIFLAQEFTPYQRNAIGFKDLPIELWEVRMFENNTLLFEQLKAVDAKESIKTVSRDQTIQSVSRQVKVHTVEEHFEGWGGSKALYDQLRDRVLDLDSRIVENPKNHYIGFKINDSNLITVHSFKSKVVVHLIRTRPEDLDDPKKKATYQKNCLKYYNQHISEVPILDNGDIEYAMFLIKQCYDRQFSVVPQ